MGLMVDKHFVHRGITLAELMWSETDHVPQFTNVREIVPVQNLQPLQTPGRPPA